MALAILPFVLLLTTIVAAEPAAMAIQECTETGGVPKYLQVSTEYASSVITCSFICKTNPNCKTFTFSDSTCSLYWANPTQAVGNGGTTSMVTCTDYNKKVCPQTIEAGKLQCTYSDNRDFCYCISSMSKNWTNAQNSCNYYGMKLIAVETASKHSFIVNFIDSYIISDKTLNIWTSGQRQGSQKRSFIWKSTGTSVNFTISNSSAINFSGDSLTYLWNNGTAVWNDRYPNETHRFLCEFQLQ